MVPELRFTSTPLMDLPVLAREAGIGRVFVKAECDRPLGNFKVLGGTLASLRALAGQPAATRLLCASDGNHGLAVAVAAHASGALARIYLPVGVSPRRAVRIEAAGGEIAWIAGTYDDAVEAAARAAANGEGILIPDTTSRPSDPVVEDVMEGYGRICIELAEQLPAPPTHMFVQAGVGGLAAAMAEGLHGRMAAPKRLVVVEPEAAACVAAGLRAGRPVRLDGDLHTCAEMLSCGLASAPALRILVQHDAQALLVSEEALERAGEVLRGAGGPSTTPSGAAGLAGLLTASRVAAIRTRFELASDSRVLIIATEGDPVAAPSGAGVLNWTWGGSPGAPAIE